MTNFPSQFSALPADAPSAAIFADGSGDKANR